MSDIKTRADEFKKQMEKDFPTLPKLPDKDHEDIIREADETLREIEEFIKRCRE